MTIRNIIQPILKPIVRAINEVYGFFNPISLFSSGEQGAWYDPSDINLTWRRNLLTYTEQFDNAVWVKFQASVTANSTTSPDGTTTADSLVNDGTNNFHGTRNAAFTSASSPFTYSVYFKAGTISNVSIALTSANNYTSDGAVATFDLSAGVVSKTAGPAYVSSSITSAGNGWYRCSLTASNAALAYGWAWLNSTNNPTYAGFGNEIFAGTAGQLVYIWGAQLEAGSTATAYQKITDGVQDYYTYQAQPILFQDSAGTTPVTAVEQPVGLMLDKSKGLVLGSELVTNGDFSNGTTGWSAVGASLSASTGALVLTNTAGYGSATQTFSVTAGKWYRINATPAAGTANPTTRMGSASFTYDYLNATNSTAPISKYFYATTNTVYVYLVVESASVGATATFDNISVRELPGNHAFQTTSASRPVLSARYNLLTKTEDFSDAVWTKTGASITPNQTTAPDGTNTADLMTATATTGRHQAWQIAAANTTSSLTATAWFKAGNWQYVHLAIYDGGSIFFTVVADIVNGTITQTTTNGATLTGSSITADGAGYRIRMVGNFATVSTGYVSAGLAEKATGNTFNSGIPTFTAAGTETIYLWGADCRFTNDGVGIPAYQRVDTATSYDTVGFKPYLKFDGVDDFLQTNSIDFTATDKMTVWAGLGRFTNPAVYGAALELSNAIDSYNGTFGFGSLPSNAQWYSKGNVGVALAAGGSAPVVQILTGIGDISGDSSIFRINGSQVASSTSDQGTGNYGNYPMYIGRRAGSLFPFNGRIYSLIIRGAQSTDAQIASTENWVNQKTKAYA